MSHLMTEAADPALAGIVPADVAESYFSQGLDLISDARLFELAADVISRPKVAAADSFVLHAPLELLARMALLPLVEPQDRDLARQRLVWLAATYGSAGADIDEPVIGSYDGAEAAVAHLAAAVAAGDLDDADRAAHWLAAAVTPSDLSRLLAADVLPRLSAAGHGPIFLFLLPRVAPRSVTAAGMVRGLVRELARHPEWVLTWHQRRHRVSPGSGDLVERLARPPSPGDPGGNFIFPTMSLAESSGLAADLLDDATQTLDLGEATRDLLRLAAWSMLQDDPDQSPYGWTHCLTMPQAALGIAGVAGIPESGADPQDAVAVAATFVLGFRSTQGRVDLDPWWVPGEPPAGDALDSLAASPPDAARATWHAADSVVPRIVTRLATMAAVHPDAHLAKYTLACLDASNSDPAAGRLYLAAAAHLHAWWARRPPLDDPLVG